MTVLAVAAGAAVLAGAVLQSTTGFGFALVAAPLLFAATSPPEAVGLLLALGLVANLLTLATERRRPAPLGGEVVWLLAWSLPGMVAGVLVLRSLDETALQVLVTAGVLASLAARRLGSDDPTPPPRWALPAAGLTSGALNTATSTSGPPLVLYLLHRRVAPAQVRDTLTVVFLCFAVLGLAVLAVSGTEEAVPDPVWVAATVPLVLTGHLAGRRAFARLAPERYDRVLTLTLVATALAGLLAVAI